MVVRGHAERVVDVDDHGVALARAARCRARARADRGARAGAATSSIDLRVDVDLARRQHRADAGARRRTPGRCVHAALRAGLVDERAQRVVEDVGRERARRRAATASS